MLAIDINQNKEAQMYFIATLLQIEENVLEVQVENWQNVIVIVLRMENVLQIYLTKNDFQVAVNLEPIQRIKIGSSLDRFVLFNRKQTLSLVLDTKSDTTNKLV